MLIRFRLRNFRSFRDTTELVLTDPRFKAVRPPDGDWKSVLAPVAGIYGANASGKSTLLEGLGFLVSALRYSGTRWTELSRFPHEPFELDDVSVAKPSLFELDYVSRGVRYNYGFESSSEGIRSEWLYAYGSSKPTRIFEREGQQFVFQRGLGRDLPALGRAIHPHALFLPVGARTGQEILHGLHHRLANHISVARFDEADQASRIGMVCDALLDDDPDGAPLIRALVKQADLGIESVDVTEAELPDAYVRHLRDVWEEMPELERADPNGPQSFEELVAHERLALRFMHTGGAGSHELPAHRQSRGTLAWLSLVVPSLRALGYGETLLIDELDASLHPRLSASLIGLFQAETNARGAQLIFTSHDTSLLGPQSEASLGRDSVWFAEKRSDGSSELYSLAEFGPRRADNVERRYLQGRYGAVPMVSASELSELTGGLQPNHVD